MKKKCNLCTYRKKAVDKGIFLEYPLRFTFECKKTTKHLSLDSKEFYHNFTKVNN